MVKLSRTKETKKIMVQYDIYAGLELEDCAEIFLPLCLSMFEGFDPKTITEKIDLDKSLLKDTLKSQKFETYINMQLSLIKIGAIPDEAGREEAMDKLEAIIERGPLKSPKYCKKGFFYIDNCWVKQDKKGQTVERIELPKEENPANEHLQWLLMLRNKFLKEISGGSDNTAQAKLENPLYMMGQVYKLMFDRDSLKTIAEKTGLNEESVEKILVSRELEHTINSAMSLAEVYRIPNETDMEAALLEYTKKYNSMEKGSFNDPLHHVKGFSYVDNCWVKKDRAGKIVKRIERLETREVPHAHEKWFLYLMGEYNYYFQGVYNMRLEGMALDHCLRWLVRGGDNN